LLLDLIKEINFNSFIDLKRKLFYFNDKLDISGVESEQSTFRVIIFKLNKLYSILINLIIKFSQKDFRQYQLKIN